MRRSEFAMHRDDAVRFLRDAVAFHLVGTTDAGEPVMKTLHGVVVGDWLCFHSAPKGEKTSLLGRPVVALVEEEVVRVPSYFIDAERACPATTLFRSVQVHGTLLELTDPALKAQALQALMEKLQPEGGHAPITTNEPMYAPQLRGLLVAGVPLERLDGKAKLAQNRTPAERSRLLEQLWRRGAPGDAKAIEMIRSANTGLTAAFLEAPEGLRLHTWLPETYVEEAVNLLRHLYWNDQFSLDELRRAHRGSTAWVGATDESGQLVASARAVSDGGKYAWVYDVVVHPHLQRRGVGQALMRLLLDHPAVRGSQRVLLGTRDAQSLYARFGFVPRSALPPRPYSTTEMVLVRALTSAQST